jgi:hypothetical protein
VVRNWTKLNSDISKKAGKNEMHTVLTGLQDHFARQSSISENANGRWKEKLTGQFGRSAFTMIHESPKSKIINVARRDTCCHLLKEVAFQKALVVMIDTI